ncbi:sortase domain-containing protein [Herbiconiux sp. SYSU D00978]|uniref:sortase domain-containing protein n=1 Tax=Herbiconiux sp. SYSU D00978 TaxID=2812562 RepID=UPI001A9564F7|nr:sortase [Herbiconiux sp. SYSU D00978]
MTHSGTGRHLRLSAGVAALLLLSGCSAATAETAAPPPSPSATAAPSPTETAPPTTAPPTEEVEPSVALALPAAAPVSVDIPSTGITSELIETGLREDNSLEVPPTTDGAPASWYSGSAAPGSAGVSVLLGHITSATQAGVFYTLGDLQLGERVSVARADGATAVFEVYQKETYPKDEFPTQAVYYPTQGAELRLITCDAYDGDRYANNLVVYAKLVEVLGA